MAKREDSLFVRELDGETGATRQEAEQVRQRQQDEAFDRWQDSIWCSDAK